MALVKCPECGKEISDKAISCPGCGAPSKKAASVQKVTSSNVGTGLAFFAYATWLVGLILAFNAIGNMSYYGSSSANAKTFVAILAIFAVAGMLLRGFSELITDMHAIRCHLLKEKLIRAEDVKLEDKEFVCPFCKRKMYTPTIPAEGIDCPNCYVHLTEELLSKEFGKEKSNTKASIPNRKKYGTHVKQ